MRKGQKEAEFIKKYNISKYNYFCHMRVNSTVDECRKFFLKNKDNVFFKNKLKKMYFPNVYEMLGRRLQYNGKWSLKELLEWDLLIFENYHEMINNYLELKTKYERYLFSSLFQDAWNILCQIEKDCGSSLWLIEQQFNILDCLKMTEEMDQLFEEYQNITCNSLVFNILKYIKWRKSQNISFIDYERYVNNILSQKRSHNISAKYLKNRIVFKKDIDKADFLLILQIDEAFSLIDLYETFVQVCLKLVYTDDKDIDRKLLTKCSSKINDKRLEAMLIYCGEPYFIRKNIQQQQVFKLLESYSKCKWNEAELLLEEYLNEYSDDFMMTHLYLKCLVFQNKLLTKSTQIKQAIYDLYVMSKSASDSRREFENLWKRYYGTSWQYKIETLIERKILCELDGFSQFVSFCYDTQITPLFVKILDDSVKKSFIDTFVVDCPDTVSLLKYQYGFSEEVFHISDKMKEYYVQICRGYELKDYHRLVCVGREALNYINFGDNNLTPNHKAYFYHKARICRYLFKGLMQIRNIAEAIQLFGDMYFENESLVKRLEINQLVMQIEDERNRDEIDLTFLGSIYTPVIYFYLYGNEKPEKVIIAYRDFLFYNNAFTLNSWKDRIGSITKTEIYFLYNICSSILLERDYCKFRFIGTPFPMERCTIPLQSVQSTV